MDKTHPSSSLMVVRSLHVKNDPFRPCEKGENLLYLEVSYLIVIGSLMYVANCTCPDSQVQFCSNSKKLECYQAHIVVPPRNN